MEMREQYEKLRKNYKLPGFEELDKYFEISSIEHTPLRLSDMRKKINEKIETFSDLLGNLLHPNTELSCLYELSFFDDEEKDKIFDLYKRLMVLSRTALELSLENDEKKEAEFINNSFKEWELIKNPLFEITKKLRAYWKRKEDTKFKAEYLG